MKKLLVILALLSLPVSAGDNENWLKYIENQNYRENIIYYLQAIEMNTAVIARELKIMRCEKTYTADCEELKK